MAKKKGINWKKVGKKFNKAGDWLGNNINPAVLNGTYGTESGFDFGDSYHPKRRTHHKKHSKSRHSGGSRGKTITIKIN